MKKTRLQIAMIILCGALAGVTNAQGLIQELPEPPRTSIADRLFWGGNLGAQFGTYTFLNISPMGGIKVTDRWSVALQPSFSYVRLRYTNAVYQDYIYGGSVLTRYFVMENLFAHAEYQQLRGDWKSTGSPFFLPSLFVGGGYIFRLSDQVGFTMSGLFNLLQTPYSPYRNPLLAGGFSVGL